MSSSINSTSIIPNNMYKYLRGSIGAKDNYQMLEEVLLLDQQQNHTKSEKLLKNPYLQPPNNRYNIKNKSINTDSTNNVRIRYQQIKKIKPIRNKHSSEKSLFTSQVNSNNNNNYESNNNLKLSSLKSQSVQNIQLDEIQQSEVKTTDHKLIESSTKISLTENKISIDEDVENNDENNTERKNQTNDFSNNENKIIKNEILGSNIISKNTNTNTFNINSNINSNNNTNYANNNNINRRQYQQTAIPKHNSQLADTLDIYGQSSGIYHLMQKSLQTTNKSGISQSVDRKHYLPQIHSIDKSDEPLLIKLIRYQQLLDKEKSSRIRQSYLNRKNELIGMKNPHTQNLKQQEKQSNKIQDELKKKIEYYKKELENERKKKQTMQELTEQLKILMREQNLMNKSLLPYITVKDTLSFFSQNRIFSFFYIGKGNNSDIVRRILETRVLMQEVEEIQPEVHFEWHPFSRPIQFAKLGTKSEAGLQKKIVNHLEFHHEITTKSNLVKNMKNYCSENKLDVFQYTPITFEINVDGNNFQNEMKIFLQYYMKNLPSHLKTSKNQLEIKKRNGKIQFPLRETQQSNPLDKNQTQTPNFIMKESYLAEGKSPYVWLLKPVNLNRGRGIEVFSTLEQLEKLINEYYIGFPEKSFKEEQEKLLEEQENNKQQDLKINQSSTQINSSSIDNNNIVKDQEMNQSEQKTLVKPNIKESEIIQDVPSTDDKSEESDEQKDKQLKLPSNQILVGQKIRINNLKPDNKSSLIIPSLLQNQNRQVDQSKQNQQQNNQLMQFNIAKGLNLLPRKPQTATGQNPQIILQNKNSQPHRISNIKSPILTKEKPKFIISENSFVIQKYIERPLLINKRKFDIRVWVLVTDNMEVLVFKQGYLRMSSESYDISDLQNPFIHLTNNAVQQYSKNYGKFENGNQMSFPEFQVFLDNNYPDKGYTMKNTIFPQMEEEIKISLQSIKNKLNMNQRPNCFEIFGYDFIIDDLFNVWIIEVNTNPCIEESSPILKVLIPRMLDDAFKLTIDQILQINLSNRNVKFPVNGYHDDENMWKYLCSLQPSYNNNRQQQNTILQSQQQQPQQQQ